VVLLFAAAQPAPLRAAARGEAAGDQPHRAAARQLDLQRRVRRHVAAGRDPARPREQPQGFVDRRGLDDAVEVEAPAYHEHAPVEPDRAGGRNAGRLVARLELVEVPVGARFLERVAQGRHDEPAGGLLGPERRPDHAREERRHQRRSVRRVDAAQLAAASKAAEGRIADLEQRAHAVELRRRGTLDHDLAAHRLEAVHGRQCAPAT